MEGQDEGTPPPVRLSEAPAAMEEEREKAKRTDSSEEEDDDDSKRRRKLAAVISAILANPIEESEAEQVEVEAWNQEKQA